MKKVENIQSFSVVVLIFLSTGLFCQNRPIGLQLNNSHVALMGSEMGQAGNKLYWDPLESMLLLGTGNFLIANTWNLDSIGKFALSQGAVNRPYGDYNTIFGRSNYSQSDFATVFGEGNQVFKNDNILNPGNHCTVWGTGNKTHSSYVTAFGEDNIVHFNAYRGTVWGLDNQLDGNLSTSWGRLNRTGGDLSTAIGYGNISKGYASLTVGLFCDTIQGMNDQFLPNNETPLFVVGNGNNPSFRSTALSVFKGGMIKVGSGPASSDLHIKQSETEVNGGTGGIILENDIYNDYWQIHHSGLYLSFSKDGERIGYISDTGSYIDDENFAPENQPVTKSQSSASFDISKIQIGTSSIKKNKKEVKINTTQFLKDYPDMVIYDENGKPFGIDYRQLYLMAISTIQDQIVTNESQNDQIENLKKEIEHLKKAIQVE